MALLNDILKWTESLPLWQRDACRRLFQKEDGLGDIDYSELYALLKKENGIGADDVPEALPLSNEHLPTGLASGDAVILLTLRNLENVNQIPSNHALSFSVIKGSANLIFQIDQYKIVKAIEFIQNFSNINIENIRQLEWIYLRFFRFSEVQPRYLFKYVTENPDFFAQLIIWIYKRNDDVEEKDDELPQEKLQQRNETAWELLDTFSILPGVTEEGIDNNILNSWVDAARTIFKESGRVGVGDSRIGTLLAGTNQGVSQ